MSQQTFTTVGQTLIQDEANNKYSSSYYHVLRLSVTLNFIDTEAMKANVTMQNTLISKYIAWSNDSIIFGLAINGESKGSKTVSSGGDASNKNLSETYVEWSGDIPYNEDGTLTVTFTATSRDKNGATSPPNQTAEIVATFPPIETSDIHIGSNGSIQNGTVYVGVNGVPVKGEVYIALDGKWVKAH